MTTYDAAALARNTAARVYWRHDPFYPLGDIWQGWRDVTDQLQEAGIHADVRDDRWRAAATAYRARCAELFSRDLIALS